MNRTLGEIPFIAELPSSQFQVRTDLDKRVVYCEASVDDGTPDYQNETIALTALWDSRDYFLQRGIIDIAHWASLADPEHKLPRLEYIIGQPTGVKKRNKSIFVKSEIFNPTTTPPEGSSGEWAEKFWHSLAHQNPPMKWYPSVFGHILDATIQQNEDGTMSRRITKLRWSALAFHYQVQHPSVSAVSLNPMGGFEREDTLAKSIQNVTSYGGLHFQNLGQLAKAMTGIATVGNMSTDPTTRTGIAALTSESTDEDEDLVKAAINNFAAACAHNIKAGKLERTPKAIKAHLKGKLSKDHIDRVCGILCN